jgi:CTP synthase (UTP-ammonia lyase)
VLVEHARNLLGIDDASHAEYGGNGTPVITALACSLVDSQIEVTITPGSRLAQIHGGLTSLERTHCRYGLAPSLSRIASQGGLAACAIDGTGEVRAVERADHPLFLATLYQPQRSSRPGAPHPIWRAFIEATSA